MLRNFSEHLRATKGHPAKAMKAFMRERRWGEEAWYLAWRTTDLPAEVANAFTALDTQAVRG